MQGWIGGVRPYPPGNQALTRLNDNRHLGLESVGRPRLTILRTNASAGTTRERSNRSNRVEVVYQFLAGVVGQHHRYRESSRERFIFTTTTAHRRFLPFVPVDGGRCRVEILRGRDRRG